MREALGFAALTTSLRIALTVARRAALIVARRAALTAARRGALTAARRGALTAARRGALTAVALAALTAAPAFAQPETLYLRTLASNCAQCHGTEGHAAPGSALPALAGMPRDYLLAQLQAFKAGTRTSTIMQQLARGYSDAQLEQLAAFFAAQRKP